MSDDPQGQTKQPLPLNNDRPAVWDLVMDDIAKRDRYGKFKYGTRLQPFNGRDSLRDAYEESLDLVVYLRQLIYERDHIETFRDALADKGQIR